MVGSDWGLGIMGGFVCQDEGSGVPACAGQIPVPRAISIEIRFYRPNDSIEVIIVLFRLIIADSPNLRNFQEIVRDANQFVKGTHFCFEILETFLSSFSHIS